MPEAFWVVTFYLKSGQAVQVEYDQEAVVEEVKQMLVDPILRQYELEDDDQDITTVIPRRNVDYIEVKAHNVQ